MLDPTPSPSGAICNAYTIPWRHRRLHHIWNCGCRAASPAGLGQARDVYRSVPMARSERCLICVDVAFDTSKVSFFTRRGYRQRDKISLISTPRRRPRITEKRNAKKIGLCIRCGAMDYSKDSLERNFRQLGTGQPPQSGCVKAMFVFEIAR